MARKNTKKPSLEKESTLNHVLNLKETKVINQEEINCKHCLKFSGFTNSELAQFPIHDDREIKCLNCGKTCIKIKKTIGYAVPLYTLFSDFNHN